MNEIYISQFVSFLPMQKPGMDVADGYVTFVRHSQDMLREKVNEEVYIERLFDVSKLPLHCLPLIKKEGLIITRFYSLHRRPFDVMGTTNL